MRTITRNLSTAVVLTTSLLASSSLLAVQPGTRTPDQMVNLQVDKNTPCPFYGSAVNQQVNSDGTLSPFTIPDGYSLVITGLDWFNNVVHSNAATRWEARLTIQGAAPAIIFSDFAANSGQYYQGGSAQGITDVVVKSGVSLCYGHPDWATSSAKIVDVHANVHGYLIKSRGSKGDYGNEGGSNSHNRR